MGFFKARLGPKHMPSPFHPVLFDVEAVLPTFRRETRQRPT